MIQDFAPRLDILPPPQLRLWDELAAVPSEFVLYGGTAIALQPGHRPPGPTKRGPAIGFLAAAIVTQHGAVSGPAFANAEPG